MLANDAVQVFRHLVSQFVVYGTGYGASFGAGAGLLVYGIGAFIGWPLGSVIGLVLGFIDGIVIGLVAAGLTLMAVSEYAINQTICAMAPLVTAAGCCLVARIVTPPFVVPLLESVANTYRFDAVIGCFPVVFSWYAACKIVESGI